MIVAVENFEMGKIWPFRLLLFAGSARSQKCPMNSIAQQGVNHDDADDVDDG